MTIRRMMITVSLAAVALVLSLGGISGAAQNATKAMRQEGQKEQTGLQSAPYIEDHQEAVDTVNLATQVFKNFTDKSAENIPASVLQNAAGVIIIPEVIKAGLIVAGRHGTGILVVRNPKNQHEWSLPVFVSITGGSVGAQAGVESSDLVLVMNQQDQLNTILSGSDFTLGVDASVAAGTLGAKAKASTKDAVVLAYQKTKGLFAGVSLTGSVLTLSEDATKAYYNLDEEKIRGYVGNEENLYQRIINEGEQVGGEKKLIAEIPKGVEDLRNALKNYVTSVQ